VRTPSALLALVGVGGLLLLAGCGSSSHHTTPPAPRATRKTGWDVFGAKTVPGRLPAVIGGDVINPVALEVKVASTPIVDSQVNYSVDCEKSGTHPIAQTVRLQRTPITVSIPVIPYAAWCFVDVTASKSHPAVIRITLLSRPRG
jgi:hypothetical protein